MITPGDLVEQEKRFASAFRAKDVNLMRPLYRPDVVYVSPTVRLFGWPATIEGVDRALGFVQLTILALEEIRYEAVESAIVDGGQSAFVRIHFDWTRGDRRLRSNYVVIYRYAGKSIARQELYYDPSATPESI